MLFVLCKQRQLIMVHLYIICTDLKLQGIIVHDVNLSTWVFYPASFKIDRVTVAEF